MVQVIYDICYFGRVARDQIEEVVVRHCRDKNLKLPEGGDIILFLPDGTSHRSALYREVAGVPDESPPTVRPVPPPDPIMKDAIDATPVRQLRQFARDRGLTAKFSRGMTAAQKRAAVLEAWRAAQ